MKRGWMALPAGIMACGLAAVPAVGEDKAAAPDAYNEAAKAMTDSMMTMMGGMFKMWSQASKPMWQSTSQMFGENSQWCVSCHAELDNVYQKFGEAFDANVHKKLTNEEMSKALDAYGKPKTGN
jgi:hypothetical protein